MKVSRFMAVETGKGNRLLINVDYVIALHEKSDADGGGADLYVADATGEGGRINLGLEAQEAARVRAWLLEH